MEYAWQGRSEAAVGSAHGDKSETKGGHAHLHAWQKALREVGRSSPSRCRKPRWDCCLSPQSIDSTHVNQSAEEASSAGVRVVEGLVADDYVADKSAANALTVDEHADAPGGNAGEQVDTPGGAP